MRDKREKDFQTSNEENIFRGRDSIEQWTVSFSTFLQRKIKQFAYGFDSETQMCVGNNACAETRTGRSMRPLSAGSIHPLTELLHEQTVVLVCRQPCRERFPCNELFKLRSLFEPGQVPHQFEPYADGNRNYGVSGLREFLEVFRSCRSAAHQSPFRRNGRGRNVRRWPTLGSRFGRCPKILALSADDTNFGKIGNATIKVCSLTSISTWFERVSMLVILLNCVTLGMYQPCEEGNCDTTRCKILQVSVVINISSGFFQVFFTG